MHQCRELLNEPLKSFPSWYCRSAKSWNLSISVTHLGLVWCFPSLSWQIVQVWHFSWTTVQGAWISSGAFLWGWLNEVTTVNVKGAAQCRASSTEVLVCSAKLPSRIHLHWTFCCSRDYLLRPSSMLCPVFLLLTIIKFLCRMMGGISCQLNKNKSKNISCMSSYECSMFDCHKMLPVLWLSSKSCWTAWRQEFELGLGACANSLFSDLNNLFATLVSENVSQWQHTVLGWPSP